MDRNIRLALLIMLSVLLFSANLGGISIYILDEAKNSSCAREMLERNDLIIPTFNYQLRTDKPPLHYFFMMLAYQLFGINEFAARFFSAVFGISTVLTTYFFTKRFIDEKAAFWSAIVLLSSIQVVLQFHQAVPDPYLIFFFSLAMFLLYAFYIEGKNGYLFIAYVFIGLGLLAKGPVILVLCALVMLAFLLLQKQLQSAFWLYKPITGILIVLAVALPWYIAVGLRTDWEWITGFFFRHNLDRFSRPMEGHGGSVFLIPLYIFWGLFPFSIFLIQAVYLSFRERRKPLLIFSICVLAVIFCFFTVSQTKLPNYPAPAFPFIAIILGFYLSRVTVTNQYKSLRWSLLFYLLVSIALPIAIFLVIDDLLKMPGLRKIAYWFLFIPAGAFAAIIFIYRRKYMYSMASIAASWIITSCLFFYLIFPKVDRQNPVYKALKVIDASKKIYYYDRYNPAFSFYIRKPIRRIVSIKEAGHANGAFILSRKKSIEAESLPEHCQIIKEDKELFEPVTSIVLYAQPDRSLSNSKKTE